MPLTKGVRRALLGSRRTYSDIMASVAADIWFNFNEASGTTVINYGSLAAANATWTPGTSGALGQTDSMGQGHAYLLDGATSDIRTGTLATINNASVFTVGQRLRADGPGEGNVGFLWTDNGANRTLSVSADATSPYRLALNIWCTSVATGVTTDPADGLILGKEMWVFSTYDDTAASRRPRIYFGYDGAVREALYSTETPAATALSNASGALVLGNRGAAADRTFNGQFGEFFFKVGTVLTLATMTAITQATYT